jgi:hypothetical protein
VGFPDDCVEYDGAGLVQWWETVRVSFDSRDEAVAEKSDRETDKESNATKT